MNPHHSSFRAILGAAAAVLVAFAIGGCSSAPKPPKGESHAIEITASGQIQGLPVTVWVVPARWDDDLIKGDVDSLITQAKADTFPGQQSYPASELKPKKFLKNDVVWSNWIKKQRAECLVVLADIPKVLDGAMSRRVAVSLDRRDWRGFPDRTIVINIDGTRGAVLKNGPKR